MFIFLWFPKESLWDHCLSFHLQLKTFNPTQFFISSQPVQRQHIVSKGFIFPKVFSENFMNRKDQINAFTVKKSGRTVWYYTHSSASAGWPNSVNLLANHLTCLRLAAICATSCTQNLTLLHCVRKVFKSIKKRGHHLSYCFQSKLVQLLLLLYFFFLREREDTNT